MKMKAFLGNHNVAALTLALGVAAVGVSAPVQAAITINGSLDPSGSVLPTRIYRDSVPSTCGSAKAFPGTTGTGPYAYSTHTASVPSGGGSQCITVSVDVGTCDTTVFVAAYQGAFDPANLATNYLGDQGSSVTGSFSFMAPAGSTITLMASKTTGAVSCNYSITSAELNPSAIAAVPALGAGGLAVLGMVAAGLGLAGARRRRA